MGLRTVLTCILLSSAAHAALYTDSKQLPTDTYDFVVVGAGAAGNVIAARLTENPKVSVLLIEAGISNEGVLGVEAPFLAPSNLPQSAVTWNYTTTPQSSLNGRSLGYSRGRVLGGSSSINFMTYTRGSNAEYDRWAQLTGDSGWAWSNLSKYYFKSSRLVPSQARNNAGLVDPKDHGNGPIEVSLPDFPSELDDRVVKTAKTTPEFPFNIDFQSGNSVGVSPAQSTAGKGERSSSATAYLEPALGRSNLDVLIQNTVTKLIATGNVSGKPSFKKVEFAPSSGAARSVVTARNEVVLSAGSIGTPQILLLSGIGDATELSALNIPTSVNLPDVGKNLQDHPILSNYFTVNSSNTFDDVVRDANVFAADLTQWQTNRTGLFANPPANSVAFLRVPSNDSIFKTYKDPTPSGNTTPHFEMIFADGFAQTVIPEPATGYYLTINTAVVSPLSVGSLRLASNDPFADPLIDPNFFSSPFDQYVMLQAIKAARRFVETPAWDGFVTGRYGPIGTTDGDAAIMAAAKDAVVTIWHPTSTAKMTAANSKAGVVDPSLLVKGVSGLRIVDASVFPVIPAAHPVAFVYILAERAADLIKQQWKL